MSELRTRVEELKMENEYQLRLKDMNYNEKIKDLTDKFIQEIEALKAKNEVILKPHTIPVYNICWLQILMAIKKLMIIKMRQNNFAFCLIFVIINIFPACLRT